MSTILWAPRRPRRSVLDAFGLGAVELILRPERFFRALLRFHSESLPLLPIWVTGVASAIGGLEARIALMQAFGRPVPPELVRWILVWPMLLVVGGLIGGYLEWLVGGWWFRVRLRFCGAPQSTSKREARLVWLYANLVTAVPGLALKILVTPLHQDFLAAANADPFSLMFVPLLFWSFFVGYRGAVSCFPVKSISARWWFLILPLAWYALIVTAAIAVPLMIRSLK